MAVDAGRKLSAAGFCAILVVGAALVMSVPPAGAEEKVPYYSGDTRYPAAPLAVGLPTGPAEMSRTYPGLYSDYEGEMFGEGAYYIAGPQQPLAKLEVTDLALKPSGCPNLKILAVVRTGYPGHEAFDVARRLGADIVSVPVAFGSPVTAPRGNRCNELSMKKLREALKDKVDVILVNKLIGVLPEEAQSLILQKVESGAGLLVVGPLPGKGPLMAALPVENPDAPMDETYNDFKKVQAGGSWIAGGVAFSFWPGLDTAKLMPWIDFDPRCANMLKFKPKAGADSVPGPGGFPLIISGMIGKGRAVVMGYSGNRWDGSYLPNMSAIDEKSLMQKNVLFREQMYSLLLRAVVFAAAGQPAIRVEWPEGDPLVWRKGAPIKFMIANSGASPVGVRVRLVLRDGPTGDELWNLEKSIPILAGGKAEAAVELPMVPAVEGAAGRADPLLEVKVVGEDDCSIDWGTVPLAVEGAEPPKVALKSDVVYPGEKAEAAVEVSAASSWRAVDLWGRVIAAGSMDAGKTNIEFVPDFRSGLVTLILDLADKGGVPLGRAVREIYTPMYDRDRDYFNLIWPRGKVDSVNASVMRRQGGISVVLGGGYFGNTAAMYGLLRSGAHVAMTNVGPRQPYIELDKFPEPSDKNMELAKRNYVGGIGRYGPVTLHLQDERHSPAIKDPKLSPALLGEFRAWIKNQYKDIAELNASWQSSYGDFAEVAPSLDVKNVIAKPGTIAPWLDFLRFVDQKVAMEKDMDLVKLLDAETRGKITVGFEGIFGLYGGHLSPYSGLNVPMLFDSGAKMNNMAYGIGTPMWELCASLNPDADSGTWLGYESERSTYRTEPWRGVLSGATFMGWFIDSLWFTAEGAVGERLSWVEQYTRPLRQGVGRLLIESRRQFDGVAILANMRSSQAAWMIGKQMDPAGDGRGGHWMLRPMEDSGNAFLTLNRDCGLSPSYITEGQILKGELKRFKALCLVFDVSVDTAVAAAIREWVKDGGVLIADCGAGSLDQHGKFLAKGQLDDVFGIRREGALKIDTEAGDFTVGLMNPAEELVDKGCQKGNWYMVEYYESNIKPDTAKAMGQYVFGKRPDMCFWNSFGKGRALYLGFLLNRYRTGEGDFTSVLPLYRAALAHAGIRPKVEVTVGGGTQLKGFTVNNFLDGDSLYTGLMRREADAPSKVVLDFPREGHLYEVMTNRYIGHGRRFDHDLATGEPVKAGLPTLEGKSINLAQDSVSGMALFALMPYKIADVSVDAESARQGGQLKVAVKVEVEGAAPGKHVLHLDVRDPEGRQAEPYCRNIVTQNGSWEGTLPLALNEMTGRWNISVREAVSGLASSTTVKIK